MRKRDDELNREWHRGYVCAVAKIVLMHGEDTIAKDVLREGGRIDWSDIDDYDKDVLREANILPTTQVKE